MKKIVLPNFFIVGAPKCGTTSLYFYLNEHPEVFMCPIKEPEFFSYEEIEAQNLYYRKKRIKDLNDYAKLFKGSKNAKAIGEASVSYLFYPNVPLKIKKLVPATKIIIILRDPVERAYSHYLMDFKMGYIETSFEQVILKKTNSKWADLYYQQYVELGLYYEQVKRYLDAFGYKQVMVLFNEDLKENTEKTIMSLFDFLQVSKDFVPNVLNLYNTFKMPKNRVLRKFYSFTLLRNAVKKIIPRNYLEQMKKTFFHENKPNLNLEIKEYLKKIYKEDIKNLELLLNKDLSAWYRYG